MRSFFKKPSWAVNSGNSGTEFYRRSEQTYADIVAAEREAHKKPKPPPESKDSILQSHRPSKRQRLSDEVNIKDADADADDVDDASQSVEGNEPTEQEPPKSAPDRAAYDEVRALPKAPSPGSLDASLVGSSQPTLEDRLPLESPTRDPPPQEPKIGGSDMIQNGLSCSNPPTAPLPLPPSSTPIPDPTVQILITSPIPSTKPLLVHRKMSQSLREVRVEWCKRQGFAPESQSFVYLTWKGRRLFDVTTCRSLGIRAESKFALADEDYDSDAGPRELRIHMEAVTENPILLNRPGSSPSERGQAPPTPLSPGQDQDQDQDQNEPMKLILRSPGVDDFRIKARPKTLVSKLISAFRDKQGIPADQDVSLLFDGDRLDPGACLRDYDIADLDMVDVQVRQRS